MVDGWLFIEVVIVSLFFFTSDVFELGCRHSTLLIEFFTWRL